MGNKKIANITNNIFKKDEKDKSSQQTDLENLLLKFDKEIYETEFSDSQEFNKALLFKLHNLFAYRESFNFDEFIYMLRVQL